MITLLSKPRTLRCLTRRSVKFATYGFLPGLTIAPILMYVRMKGQPDEAFYDRCYRLRCNKNQKNMATYINGSPNTPMGRFTRSIQK
ncbi:unnamed protein product [Schistosoma rodhaini]|uniref:Uncharacterized protein n=2 Tax=Schistosoma rodhaini TaxID=6188 RepID=A0AA85EK77_9TREM|nr:unnamed protein product [Schistosoma rodhaini]